MTWHHWLGGSGVRRGCVAWKSFALATRGVSEELLGRFSTLFFCVCVEGGSVIRLNSNWQFRSGTLLSHGFWYARSREPSCTKRLFYVSLQKAVGCFSTKDRSRRNPFTSVHDPFVFFKTRTQHTTHCWFQSNTFVNKAVCSSKKRQEIIRFGLV